MKVKELIEFLSTVEDKEIEIDFWNSQYKSLFVTDYWTDQVNCIIQLKKERLKSIAPRSNSPSASANAEDLICVKEVRLQ